MELPMRESLKYRAVGLAAATLVGAAALVGCTPHNSEQKADTPKTVSDATPPVAKQGEEFNCHMLSDPKTLADAHISGAGEALSSIFHQAPPYIESEARAGLSTCDRSITAEIANKMGFVVRVDNIDPGYSCITWQAIYDSHEQAAEGKPTNHIGLVCLPPAVTTTTPTVA